MEISKGGGETRGEKGWVIKSSASGSLRNWHTEKNTGMWDLEECASAISSLCESWGRRKITTGSPRILGVLCASRSSSSRYERKYERWERSRTVSLTGDVWCVWILEIPIPDEWATMCVQYSIGEWVPHLVISISRVVFFIFYFIGCDDFRNGCLAIGVFRFIHIGRRMAAGRFPMI